MLQEGRSIDIYMCWLLVQDDSQSIPAAILYSDARAVEEAAEVKSILSWKYGALYPVDLSSKNF